MPIKNPIKISSDTTELEECWKNVKKQTYNSLPLETALSLPIPQKNESEGICLSGFYYGVTRGGGPGKTILRPPVAILLATYPEGRMLSFVHKSVNILFPDILSGDELGLFISNQETPNERMKVRKQFYFEYSKVVENFSTDSRLLQDEKESFLQLWDLIVEKPLLPYYHEIGKIFFAWINSK